MKRFGRDDWHDDVVRARENGATLFGLPQLHVDLGLVKFSAMFCHQQNDSKVRVVLFAAVRRRRNAHDSSCRLSPPPREDDCDIAFGDLTQKYKRRNVFSLDQLLSLCELRAIW